MPNENNMNEQTVTCQYQWGQPAAVLVKEAQR